MSCASCGGPAPEYATYCTFDCHVAHALSQGGRAFVPNGLPVTCVKANNSVLEHPHADHPTYAFPVDVEYVGPLRVDHYGDYRVMSGDSTAADEKRVREFFREKHALVYTDGNVALTMHECCYCMWNLSDGLLTGSRLRRPREWKLSAASIDEIVARLR